MIVQREGVCRPGREVSTAGPMVLHAPSVWERRSLPALIKATNRNVGSLFLLRWNVGRAPSPATAYSTTSWVKKNESHRFSDSHTKAFSDSAYAVEGARPTFTTIPDLPTATGNPLAF
jgi:hypothetical protein